MSNQLKQYTLNDEQRTLVVITMPFARSIALSYQRDGVDLDDLTQQAYLGLCDAADNYIPGGNAQFPTFARRHVTESIEVFLRHYGPGKILSRMPEQSYVNTVPFDHPDSDNPDAIVLEDIIPDMARLEYEKEAELAHQNQTTLRKLTSCLDIREKEMLEAYFQSKEPNKEKIWKRFCLGRTMFYENLRTSILKLKAKAQNLC